MFTGIIETIGLIKSIKSDKFNLILEINSNLSSELKPDQSLAHDGVCLTITKANSKSHFVTAVKETLERTNLKEYKTGEYINLERSLMVGSRLDGHFVQGHIDRRSKILKIIEHNGSTEFQISLRKKDQIFVVEKGSICVNGVSLTISKLKKNYFSVVIIPYTLEHTNFKNLQKGNNVNIEFDILGKYVQNKLA